MGINNEKNKKLTHVWYFWIALLVPLSLSFISAILIYYDQSIIFCFKKICLDYFIETFIIPIKLSGITLVSTGFAITFYRIDLSYKQSERQLVTFNQINHNTFRDDFISLFKGQDYKYKVFNLDGHWLFKSLYLDDKSNNQKLNLSAEQYMSEDFSNAMNYILENFKGRCSYIYNHYGHPISLFCNFIEVIKIDNNKINEIIDRADTDRNEMFIGKDAEEIINIFEEIYAVVYTVNSFESWRFFDINQLRIWKNYIIDPIKRSKDQAEIINIHFSYDKITEYSNEITFEYAKRVNADINEITAFIRNKFSDKHHHELERSAEAIDFICLRFKEINILQKSLLEILRLELEEIYIHEFRI